MRWLDSATRESQLTDPRIEFVFGDISNQLKQELRDFWTQYGTKYKTELQSFREAASSHPGVTPPTRRALSRQPAAIARDENQNIIGIVFVALRELDAPIGMGSHAYFQRMFIAPQFRSWALANQLYRTFLAGFDKAASERDRRAHYLMTENINPGLQKTFMRRYFSRLGFRLLGSNPSGGEVWARPLQTRFTF